MPTKTKTEYETVEKTIEYTECGVPGCPNTDEDKELIELAVNPKYEEKEIKNPVVVKQCDSFHEAEELVKEEQAEARGSRMPLGVEKAIDAHDVNRSSDGLYGFGYEYEYLTKSADADASFFVCQNCLKNHFEAVPDDYDPEKVEKIHTKEGSVEVIQFEDAIIEENEVVLFGVFLIIQLSIILFLLLM